MVVPTRLIPRTLFIEFAARGLFLSYEYLPMVELRQLILLFSLPPGVPVLGKNEPLLLPDAAMVP